jgi:regulator of protease activity HflC (stomatin/prohibitin superfamily)
VNNSRTEITSNHVPIISGGAALFLLLALIMVIGLFNSVRSTGPTEVGVLTKKFALFGESGVQPDVYRAGSTYFVWPFVTDWNTFDTKIRTLEMVMDRNRGDRNSADDLNFKTVDGNDISLDVIISYRIIPEKAPHILQNVAPSVDSLKERVVRSVARSITRDFFGQLKTEEFYVAELRDKQASEALLALNGALNPMGVQIERLSTKDYRFKREYQRAIEEKKVADQRTEKLRSEAKATYEEYLSKLEQTKGQVNEAIAKADGEFARAKLEADAYFSQQEKKAEAIRAEGEAEAKGITEMNKALSGSGGEIMVKLRLADALAGKKIFILPQGNSGIDLRSTNINELLATKGLSSFARGSVSSTPSS